MTDWALIGKMIGRLGSDNDQEILTAVRMIKQRVLLTDLAERVANGGGLVMHEVHINVTQTRSASRRERQAAAEALRRGMKDVPPWSKPR